MKTKEQKLIEKHKLFLTTGANGVEQLGVGGKPTPEEIANIRKNKSAIITELQTQKNEYYTKLEKPQRQREEQFKKLSVPEKIKVKNSPDYADLDPEYKKLANKLEPVNIPDTDGNDELAKKLMDRANGVKMEKPNKYGYFDPEFEGINLGQQATRREFEAEAQKHCSHSKLKNELYGDYTGDARRRVTQTCSCPICQLFRRRVAEERVKDTYANYR